MYLVTNRKLDLKSKGLGIFGSTPNENGPNELRLVKVEHQNDDYKVKVLNDELSISDIKVIKKKYHLNIDVKDQWFTSLKIASEIFERARKEGKSILFYVHGYNNDVEDVIRTSIELENLYNVIVIPFTWPANGGGQLSGMASYIFDKRDARASADALECLVSKIRFFHDIFVQKNQSLLWNKSHKKFPNNQEACREYYVSLLEKQCKLTINLMCHSMGNYLFKYSIKPSYSEVRKLTFDNICLIAADANNKDHDSWVNAISTRNRVYIVINENDFALKWSRRKPGEEQLPRLGHYLMNLNSKTAHYVDVTGASGVGSSHSYFKGDPVNANIDLKNMFNEMFQGKSVERNMTYRSDINVYEL